MPYAVSLRVGSGYQTSGWEWRVPSTPYFTARVEDAETGAPFPDAEGVRFYIEFPDADGRPPTVVSGQATDVPGEWHAQVEERFPGFLRVQVLVSAPALQTDLQEIRMVAGIVPARSGRSVLVLPGGEVLTGDALQYLTAERITDLRAAMPAQMDDRFLVIQRDENGFPSASSMPLSQFLAAGDVTIDVPGLPSAVARKVNVKALETLSFLDVGGVANDPSAAEANRVAMEKALAWLNARGGGNIRLPAVNGQGDYYFTAVETTFGQYNSSGQYGRSAINFLPGMANLSLIGDGPTTRIIRTDASETAQDKYSAHILINGANRIGVHNLGFVGMQNDYNLDHGTGGGISAIFGARDLDFSDLWFENCGAAAAIGIGGNRQPGETANRVDVTRPVHGVRISRCDITNCRYFCVVAIGYDVEIDGWHHEAKPHQWKGATQPGHIRRSLYFQACRDIIARGGRVFGAKKVGILLAAYPQGQGFGVLRNISISDVIIKGGPTSDFNDTYIGVHLEDNNNITAGQVFQGMQDITLSGVQIRDMITGVTCNDEDTPGATPANWLVRNFKMVGCNVDALANGITVSTKARVDLRFYGVTVNVFQNPAISAALPNRGFQVENNYASSMGATADQFSEIHAHGLMVQSGNRTGRLAGLDRSSMSGCRFDYVDDGVPNPRTTEIEYNACREIAAFDTKGGTTFTNMAGDSSLNFSAVPGRNGYGIGVTGSHWYRSGTGWRVGHTLYNDNGAVMQLGPVGLGAALRPVGDTGSISLQTPAGTNVVSYTGLGLLTLNSLLPGTMDNVRIGQTTQADGKFTGLTAMAGGAPPADGGDGVIMGPTGTHFYRAGTNFRQQVTLHNANGAVGTLGTISTGIAVRALLAAGACQLEDFAGVGMVRWTGDSKLGFYGAAGVVKPSVSGSRGGNAALASLLTQLAALGLITDTTTA